MSIPLKARLLSVDGGTIRVRIEAQKADVRLLRIDPSRTTILVPKVVGHVKGPGGKSKNLLAYAPEGNIRDLRTGQSVELSIKGDRVVVIKPMPDLQSKQVADASHANIPGH